MTLEITSGTKNVGGARPDLPTQEGRTVRLTCLSLSPGQVKPVHGLGDVWTHRRPGDDEIDAVNDVSTDAPTSATTDGSPGTSVSTQAG
jgi:hypothetical protein